MDGIEDGLFWLGKWDPLFDFCFHGLQAKMSNHVDYTKIEDQRASFLGLTVPYPRTLVEASESMPNNMRTHAPMWYEPIACRRNENKIMASSKVNLLNKYLRNIKY